MRQKLLKHILTSDNIEASIRENLKLLIVIVPEMRGMINIDGNQTKASAELWEQTLLALKNSPNDFETRLAILLHNIGKPHYLEKINQSLKFTIASAEITQKALKELKFTDDFIEKVSAIIKGYDKQITIDTIKDNPELASKILEIQKSLVMASSTDNESIDMQYITYTQQMIDEYNQTLQSN